MSRGLVLLPDAEEDIRRAVDWYDRQEWGLGEKFNAAIGRCLESVESFPDSYPLVLKNVRQAMVKPFPYGIYFRETNGVLYVHRVIHHSRHPRTWTRSFD